MQLLVKQGYTRLTLQVGKGQVVPDTSTLVCGLAVSWYRYKASLQSDMQQASLVISHGGVWVGPCGGGAKVVAYLSEEPLHNSGFYSIALLCPML